MIWRTLLHLGNDSLNVTDATAVSAMYLLYIFVGSLSFLILCGNLLVLTSIIYFNQLHTPTNFLILSLAVADLLVGVVVLPFSSIPAVISSCFRLTLICKVRDGFDFFLCTYSVWNLCFISVERYYAVCQPLRYRTKINVCVIVIMILVSWTVSALSVTLNNKNSALETCGPVSALSILPMVAEALLDFYLPAVIMCAIYLKILIVAQRQARSIQNTTCQSTKSESKMERKATKTLTIVMGVFLICWAPFFLCITFISYDNFKKIFPVIAAFKWLGWSNSMFNPFIYGFFYSWFRSAFRMIISGKIFQGDFTHSKLS